MRSSYRPQIITSLAIFLIVFVGKQIAHIYEAPVLQTQENTTICSGSTQTPNCMLATGTLPDQQHKNLLGTTLELCGKDPLTGYERDGYCKTWPSDPANHSVCAVMTSGFLQYTLAKWNDLITPSASFPGLKPWDRRCLCASRRYEAQRAGIYTEIITWATHISTLQDVPKSVVLP
jgi:uncharacterized protein